jgi:hypothetical protein
MSGMAKAARSTLGPACVLLLGGCAVDMEIQSPCDAFERSEAAPVSPDLRRKDDGTLELFVSVSTIDEAQALLAAAGREPVGVLLYPTERFVQVLRVEGGQLVVEVNSPEHATDVIDVLCIAPGDP